MLTACRETERTVKTTKVVKNQKQRFWDMWNKKVATRKDIGRDPPEKVAKRSLAPRLRRTALTIHLVTGGLADQAGRAGQELETGTADHQASSPGTSPFLSCHVIDPAAVLLLA